MFAKRVVGNCSRVFRLSSVVIPQYATSNTVCFSTSSSNVKESLEVVNRILLEPKKLKLRKSLQIDPRYRISRDEYFSMAKRVGLGHEEAEQFLHHLDQATVVNIIPQVDSYIFLKPERLVNSMAEVIDPEATELQKEVHSLQSKLKEQLIERDRLQSIKLPLDRKAEKAASRLLCLGLFAMVGHLCVVARLTWWELSWDIVEPITYMITYTTAVSLFIYFCRTKVEYNYESLFQRMVEKRKKKIYLKNGFDIQAYLDLTESIEHNTRKLEEMSTGIPPHAIFVDPRCDTSHLILADGEKSCS